LAAVLGGTQSLHTNSRDEALGLPTAHAVEIALRTQQILAYESGVADTVDPLAGSYYVEHFTDEIEDRVQVYLRQIEQLGGMQAAIESGFAQREIHNSAYAQQRVIDSGDLVVVGVNAFTQQEEQGLDVLRVDPAVGKAQVRRLEQLRRDRDGTRVDRALADLRSIASGDGNTMPAILACVEARATLGEICDALRDVFDEYRPALAI
jgi:methylmalonyl-CoA mutase N-terminal domain/subunit